jgi:hypothetical protein
MLSSSGNYKISYKRFLVNGRAHLSNDILEGSFEKINTRLNPPDEILPELLDDSFSKHLHSQFVLIC